MTIELTKGQSVSLQKEDTSKLENFCIGANWGAIPAKGLFGKTTGLFGKAAEILTGDKLQAVDLDLSLALFNEDKTLINFIYHNNLELPGMKHSGDDRVGDTDGDDKLDNEVISMKLSEVPDDIKYITITLNSYEKIDFKEIPFANIRIYEGTPDVVNNVFANFKVDNNAEFAGSMGIVLGALQKDGDEWKFNSIGKPTKDHDLEKIMKYSITLI